MTLAFNMFFFDPWPAATASNPVGWEVPPPDLVRPTGTRPAAIVPGEDGIQDRYIPPPAAFVPDAPADLRAIRPTMPSAPDLPLGGRVGLGWGFQQTDSVPMIAASRRHPYAEFPRFDAPQLTLAGIDWFSEPPLGAPPQRDPIDLHYGPLGERVDLQWGFEQYESWPPLALQRRHLYAELPALDTPLLLAPPATGTGALVDQAASLASIGVSASSGTATLLDLAAALAASGSSGTVGGGDLICTAVSSGIGGLLSNPSTMAGAGLSGTGGGGNLICTAVSGGSGDLACQPSTMTGTDGTGGGGRAKRSGPFIVNIGRLMNR